MTGERLVPPSSTLDGYHWIRRHRGSRAIPLYWNAIWYANGGPGWGSWASPAHECDWQYVAPCPSPDDGKEDAACLMKIGR